jgi:ribosomal protein L30E
MTDVIAEIKKSLKEEKLVFGADETLKGLKEGKFEKVYTAANCPDGLKDDIDHYSKLAGAEVVDTGIQNTELGDICKQPFSIAVMGLSK